MYLVDTSVLSAASPSKRTAPSFQLWLDRASDRLFLSTITVAEVEAGIARCRRIGAKTKARALEGWLAAVEHLYGDRILPFGIPEAHRAGIMLDEARAHDPGFEDIAIAATAAVHGFTVLTANLRHFRPLGVPCHDPFVTLPH